MTAEGVIEPAQAGEAAGKGDLDHRKMGVGQQLFGQKQTSGLDQLDGRDAELLLHDAAQLTRTEIKLCGDFFETRAFIRQPLVHAEHD